MRSAMAVAAVSLVALTARAETVVKPLVELGSEARYDTDPYLNGNQEVFSKISPKLGASLTSEDWKLSGWYAADVMYKAVQEQPEVDHRAALAASDQATQRLKLHADAELWRVTDPTSLPRIGLAAVDVPIFYSTAAAGLGYQLTHRLTLTVDDRQETAKIDYHNLPWSLTQTPSAGLIYQLTEVDKLSATYRYQAFIAAPTLVGQTHAALIGLDHRLTPAWHAFAAGGPLVWIDQHGAASAVPVGNVGVGRTGEFSELDAVVGHDLAGSAGYATAVWTDYAQIDTAVHPVKRLTLWLGVSAFRNGPAPYGDADIRGYGVGGGAGWAFTPELEARGSAQRLQQAASGDQQLVAIDRNIFAVQLTWTPALSPREL